MHLFHDPFISTTRCLDVFHDLATRLPSPTPLYVAFSPALSVMQTPGWSDPCRRSSSISLKPTNSQKFPSQGIFHLIVVTTKKFLYTTLYLAWPRCR